MWPVAYFPRDGSNIVRHFYHCFRLSTQIFYLPEGQKATNNDNKTLNELTKNTMNCEKQRKVINKFKRVKSNKIFQLGAVLALLTNIKYGVYGRGITKRPLNPQKESLVATLVDSS